MFHPPLILRGRKHMGTSCKRITAFVLFVWCLAPGVQCILAQSHPTAAELIQNLQSPQTTDNAKNELLKLGRSDPEIRQYLTVHLPPLIESGPGSPDCSGHHCQEWNNAVELAGKLKIGEAAPALARWINWRNPGAPVGLSLEARLVFYPAARSLADIGDLAIPAVQHALDHGNADEHFKAVRILCIIHTPKAKAVLQGVFPTESEPDLRAMIKNCLRE
jgi:hypothetical protein